MNNNDDDNDNKRKVPKFILKLYAILEDNRNDEIIKWNKEGTAFHITDLNSFCSNILPCHFNTKVYSSFVRQLNVYDFHKTQSNYNNNNSCIHEYYNIHFKRNNKSSLQLIKRKKNPSHNSSNKKNMRESKTRLTDLCLKLGELQQRIKISEGKQEFLDYCHTDLAQRNHLLRMELFSLSEKERNLENLFFNVIQKLYPKIKMTDIAIQGLSSQLFERKNDCINNMLPCYQIINHQLTSELDKNSSNEIGDEYLSFINKVKQSNGIGNAEGKNEMNVFNQMKEFQKIYMSTIDESTSYSFNNTNTSNYLHLKTLRNGI